MDGPTTAPVSGPLSGLAVLELGGIGPAPFAGMLFADLGAEVLRVDRLARSEPRGRGDSGRIPGRAERGRLNRSGYPGEPRHDLLNRGKRSVAIDLKQPAGAAAVRRLAARADVVLEGFRPGVAERLGVGPAQCRADHPRLVYCRMTGWGQSGPLAGTAGHDLTYLAVAGLLHGLGPPGGPPTPPANLLGDYGGGGMLLVAGALAALWQAERTGQGQVVDAAIVDGAALLATQLYGLRADGLWRDEPGTDLLDGGAPFYAAYPAADGRYLAVAALEPEFFAALVARLGLDPAGVPPQYDRSQWPRLRELIGQRLATRTRDEWVAAFAGSDACVAPVLSPAEAADHPHLAFRQVFIESHGVTQPAAAPRFAGTPAPGPRRPPPYPGEHTRAALSDWGVPDVEALLAAGVAYQAPENAPGCAAGKIEP